MSDSRAFLHDSYDSAFSASSSAGCQLPAADKDPKICLTTTPSCLITIPILLCNDKCRLNPSCKSVSGKNKSRRGGGGGTRQACS